MGMRSYKRSQTGAEATNENEGCIWKQDMLALWHDLGGGWGSTGSRWKKKGSGDLPFMVNVRMRLNESLEREELVATATRDHQMLGNVEWWVSVVGQSGTVAKTAADTTGGVAVNKSLNADRGGGGCLVVKSINRRFEGMKTAGAFWVAPTAENRESVAVQVTGTAGTLLSAGQSATIRLGRALDPGRDGGAWARSPSQLRTGKGARRGEMGAMANHVPTRLARAACL